MNLLPLWPDQILHPRVGMKGAHFEGEGNALASASLLENSRTSLNLKASESSHFDQIHIYTEGRRRRGHQMMRWLHSITDAMNMNSGKLRGMRRDREA